MGFYFAVQLDGHGVFLVPDFASNVDAQDFIDLHGIGGLATTQAAYNLSVFQTGVDLETAKVEKLHELLDETIIRYQAIDPNIREFNPVYACGVMGQHLTPVGVDLLAVTTAALAARVTIEAFTDIVDVENYNVVTDPAWP